MRGYIVKLTTRNKRKTWGVVISRGRDPQTGKLKQQWQGGFKTKRDAEAYLNDVLPQVQNGTWAPPSKERVSDFFTRWLRNYGATTVRPTTLASYEMIVRKHLSPALGHFALTQLTAKAIQEYFTAKLQAGLSSTTVRHHAMLLHRMLSTAVREGALIQSPADRVDIPRNHSVEMKTLDEEQARLFLAEARRSSPHYRLYLAAVLTGMRADELLGLRWSDLNLTMGTATIQQTFYRLGGSKKDGRPTQLLFKEPKTKQARRSVVLAPVMIEELRTLRGEQDDQRRMLGDQYHDYGLIFCQPNGSPLHLNDVRRGDFRKVLKRVGLPQLRFHDLRHTAATLWARGGVHPKVMQELLGHSNAAFTLQVYGHVLPGLKEQAVNEMGARLLGGKGTT